MLAIRGLSASSSLTCSARVSRACSLANRHSVSRLLRANTAPTRWVRGLSNASSPPPPPPPPPPHPHHQPPPGYPYPPPHGYAPPPPPVGGLSPQAKQAYEGTKKGHPYWVGFALGITATAVGYVVYSSVSGQVDEKMRQLSGIASSSSSSSPSSPFNSAPKSRRQQEIDEMLAKSERQNFSPHRDSMGPPQNVPPRHRFKRPNARRHKQRPFDDEEEEDYDEENDERDVLRRRRGAPDSDDQLPTMSEQEIKQLQELLLADERILLKQKLANVNGALLPALLQNTKDKTVVIKLETRNCPFCVMLEPVMDQLVDSIDNKSQFVFARLDVDANFAPQCGLELADGGTPALLIYPPVEESAVASSSGSLIRPVAMYGTDKSKEVPTVRSILNYLHNASGRAFNLDAVTKIAGTSDVEALRKVATFMEVFTRASSTLFGEPQTAEAGFDYIRKESPMPFTDAAAASPSSAKTQGAKVNPIVAEAVNDALMSMMLKPNLQSTLEGLAAKVPLEKVKFDKPCYPEARWFAAVQFAYGTYFNDSQEALKEYQQAEGALNQCQRQVIELGKLWDKEIKTASP